MCQCGSGDYAECYRERLRTARKHHECEECSATIQPGEKYWYGSGLFEGEPFSVKFCARCAILRRAHVVAEYNVTGEHCAPSVGELIEAIGECAREEPEYVAAFRTARRSLLAGEKPARTWKPKRNVTGAPTVLMGDV